MICSKKDAAQDQVNVWASNEEQACDAVKNAYEASHDIFFAYSLHPERYLGGISCD